MGGFSVWLVGRSLCLKITGKGIGIYAIAESLDTGVEQPRQINPFGQCSPLAKAQDFFRVLIVWRHLSKWW